jgi:hypothetical protein
MIAAMSAAALGSYDSGLACTPGANVELKWNAHASEWGAYEITGCAGVNPKLSLAAGTTYTFDQSDASNWCATRQRVPRLARIARAPCSSARAPSSQFRVPND